MKLPLLLGLAGLLAVSRAGRAQPAAPASDVLLLTTGQEVAGRVLTITPTELTYLPPAAASPQPDTLRLPAASVFLVRYANGTREVMARLLPPAPAAAPDPTPPALRGLSGREREARGQDDARRCYQSTSTFWGGLGSTLLLGPAIGLVTTASIGHRPVPLSRLAAPQPALLSDPSYRLGYVQQVGRTRRHHAWGGYGVAAGIFVLVLSSALAGH